MCAVLSSLRLQTFSTPVPDRNPAPHNFGQTSSPIRASTRGFNYWSFTVYVIDVYVLASIPVAVEPLVRKTPAFH
ncbi:hypothetical protein LshimejAT787_0705050 [Lyophyllum shimeji]|uniref:Uncharacterized protein n=1 Tax=Lyophyllum shimeji TaxID=47721 RepID=A0A9P3PQ48_LYOSH|nr:hypothetical protein LshimejAT787_0705050 [Lyophyllum shimeji]